MNGVTSKNYAGKRRLNSKRRKVAQRLPLPKTAKTAPLAAMKGKHPLCKKQLDQRKLYEPVTLLVL
ncbi:MAG: hypothetical protein C0469_16835 [Cyanobacteria bacterium DS2.3.42]|nr:hypothetical protein [Cyanobacteria bacterium DS2.3.42]